ncbi:hypothetical protein HRR83_005158 [Exophiala dermatitidis]|uniref:Uncharacterized protein n=1 Tax=Exophiala dermatitidis TaxID=5970 RepID=A0AAN6IUX5_EXODE|nr:hypothetical protein HRR75_004276 [Exophiala dermatitidis]KAJ4516928.1 hypothetical protein HRR74_004677 [Exophiala dermatitidis]KAJ4519893.1 hypothetical protein HRR73_003954 [Exophiala dermatitidis]KAJ4534298.1 hypothetical protein HRR76_006227 [Exophiala dermatitidis]KAJ4541481.1 hypothetical protein HRR77_006272 [Exophiala dermatitidis]
MTQDKSESGETSILNLALTSFLTKRKRTELCISHVEYNNTTSPAHQTPFIPNSILLKMQSNPPLITYHYLCRYSSHEYLVSMGFPPPDTIDMLLGKSNFHSWRATVQPALLTNKYSSSLILGDWTEPQPSDFSSQALTDSNERAKFDLARREWHTANTATCRFIRSTLAMNVTPFVRQHKNAKALFFNLIWLYGDEAGIDTQGGPAVPAAAPAPPLQKDRTSLLTALHETGGSKRVKGYLGCEDLVTGAGVSKQSSGATPSTDTSRSTFLPSTAYSADVPAQQETPTGNNEYENYVPGPALQAIHEEDEENSLPPLSPPHPGRRVPSGQTSARFSAEWESDLGFGPWDDHHDGDHARSISPLTLSDTSMTTVNHDGLDMEHFQRPAYCGTRDTNFHFRHSSIMGNDNDKSATATVICAPDRVQISAVKRSVFARSSKTTKPKRDGKLSFSFPLTRLRRGRNII